MSKRHKRRILPEQPAYSGISAVTISTPKWGEASGLGWTAMSLARGMTELGVEVSVIGELRQTGVGDPVPTLDVEPDHVIHIGKPQYPAHPDGKTHVVYGAWKMSKIPSDWRGRLTQTDGILVPSRWCANGFDGPRASQSPVVVHPAVKSFQPQRRVRKDVLRFMVFDSQTDDPSAGTEVAISAFLRAFPVRTDVALDIWTSRPTAIRKNDQRIQLHGNVGMDVHLEELYHRYDAMIFAARGEGFGMVAAEAMTSGLPVIHSGLTGMEEFADVGKLVGSRRIGVLKAFHADAYWFEPYADLLVGRLLELEARYDAWQDQALVDAEVIRSRFTPRAFASATIAALGGHYAAGIPGDIPEPIAVSG